MPDFIHVKVQFESGDQPTYTYRCVDQSIKEGDMAIIKTKSGSFKIVYVTEVPDQLEVEKPGITYTYIVQKIDTTAYDEAVAQS